MKLRAILGIWLCFFGVMQPTYAAALKSHFGHYYATDYGDSINGAGSDVAKLCAKKGITGIDYRQQWKTLEPTEGTFVWTNFNTVLNTIKALPASTGTGGQYQANKACTVWLFPEWKRFDVQAGGSNPCPSWLKDKDGNPGFAPNDQANGSIIQAIDTGAASVAGTPIVVKVTGNTFANGDVVFVDNVAGNTNANGFWTVTGRTANTITLQGSSSNATRITSGNPVAFYGRVSRGASFDCKMWDPTVKAKFNALIKAMGQQFDSDPLVEGFILQESSISLSNAAYLDGPDNGGDYVSATYLANRISYDQTCSTWWPTSRCMDFTNQIKGQSVAGLTQISDALSALPNNQGCYGGPDILPNNGGLVAGTYQALISHSGCRANSAQNTTIVGSGAGAQACDPTAVNCDNVFDFAVRGTFGHLDKTLPVPSDQGLCINSYIFWNDSATEQTYVDKTVQKFPYGPDWYDRCTCGGGPP